MQFVKEKVQVIIKKLKELQDNQVKKVDFEYTYAPDYKIGNVPPDENAGWQVYQEGVRLGGIDEHYWFRFHIEPVAEAAGKELRLSVKTGREGQWDATNPQGLVYINGVTTQGLDTNHTWVPLEYGKAYDVVIYYYTGMEENCLCDIDINLIEADKKVEQLYYDLCVPCEVLDTLQEGDHAYTVILSALNKTVMRIDLRHPYSAEFYTSIEEAIQYLKEEFYEKECGKEAITASCIGHTHIDVAWFWTVMQTKEKAQRSFSTVINMMKRYSNFKFMSSQPQLYQYIKDNDPQLYNEIKQRVKEGRWEVEGAMWLEADINLTGGESLIRQLYHGKKFMRDEFGVESHILWMPDCFGFSASLPQILRKSGVDRFYTTKFIWNETHKMPHDLFMWQGIDGTEIFASLETGNDFKITPQALCRMCKEYKDRELSDNRLLIYGWGDGGGGPSIDMIEYQKRFEYGIPGMPKLIVETVDEYFKKAVADFDKNTKELRDLPKWIGELYFELHRGTYTTMAENKKNNRKSEMTFVEAETLSVWDMLLNGATYPQETLQEILFPIMLNQFHDILPGSAIKEVYEVSDAEYAQVLAGTKSIIDGKLRAIANSIQTNGGILVYNPTPFVVSDTVTVDGKNYYAETIPAHGWKVIADTVADCGITVADKVLENDVIRICFNDQYEIVSVYDKEYGREVIEEGKVANALRVFEDYPKMHDAWDINKYYTQKMWVADDVQSVTFVQNGITVKRAYGNSVIEQTVTLHKHSKRIDFVTTIDWQEDHVLLRALFPVNVRSSHATYDIQFGHLERPTHKNTSWDENKFEVCAHKWSDLSEGNYGVSILSDSKYGYSTEENVMGISLLKAPTWPNTVADRGMHTFTYSLYPHGGDFTEGDTQKQAYLLNMPLEAIKVDKHEGRMPGCYSMISADKPNVVIETVKKSEEGHDIIVRLYDSYNCKENVVIKTGFAFKEAYLCDLMENNLQKVEHDGQEIAVQIKNFEIITLRFVL